MAALRGGIRTVLIPADNEKDLEEIDQTVRAALHFIPVEHVDTVLAQALGLDLTRPDPATEAVAGEKACQNGGLNLQQ